MRFCRLYGVMLTQTYKYYQRFGRDPYSIKLLASLVHFESYLMLTWLQHRFFLCGMLISRIVIYESIFIPSIYDRLLDTVSMFLVGNVSWFVISTTIQVLTGMLIRV